MPAPIPFVSTLFFKGLRHTLDKSLKSHHALCTIASKWLRQTARIHAPNKSRCNLRLHQNVILLDACPMAAGSACLNDVRLALIND